MRHQREEDIHCAGCGWRGRGYGGDPCPHCGSTERARGFDHLAFRVDGFPQTKGSWKVAGRKRNGAPRMLPDNPEETAWAESVAWAARAAARGHQADGRRYAVALDFTLVPPKGRANRRDLDKLARSCLDALQGVIWLDDEQVDRLEVVKGIVGTGRPKPGVAVVIAAL